MMRLASLDGDRIALAVIGYEFPDRPADPDDDDWLVVAGKFQLADGRAWAFADPCLTAAEASQLADWLAAPAGRLSFLEPDLVFTALGPYELEVRLAYEAAPADLPTEQARGDGLAVRLRMSPADLAAAAAAWRADCAAYPSR